MVKREDYVGADGVLDERALAHDIERLLNLTMEMEMPSEFDVFTANVMAHLYHRYGFPDDLAELEAKRKLS